MLTRDERRALLFLAATATVGGLVRVMRSGAVSPPGAALLAPELSSGDLAAQEASARRLLALARPLEPGERVDVDHADAAELERLPRVGPELARRIVDERAAHGPFGSLEGLGRVRGMGAGTLSGLERVASFSGVLAHQPAHPQAGQRAQRGQGAQAVQRGQRERAGPAGRHTRAAQIGPTPQAQAAVRGTVVPPGTVSPAAPPPPPPGPREVTVLVGSRSRRERIPRAALVIQAVCPSPPLSVSAATAAELACLPGIGPVLAQRIVTWRTAHGPFAEVNDLERVPGIGPATLRRLLPYVRAP